MKFKSGDLVECIKIDEKLDKNIFHVGGIYRIRLVQGDAHWIEEADDGMNDCFLYSNQIKPTYHSEELTAGDRIRITKLYEVDKGHINIGDIHILKGKNPNSEDFLITLNGMPFIVSPSQIERVKEKENGWNTP